MSMNWLAGMPPQMADPTTEQMGGPMAEHMGAANGHARLRPPGPPRIEGES
jgi:hypothetical protein